MKHLKILILHYSHEVAEHIRDYAVSLFGYDMDHSVMCINLMRLHLLPKDNERVLEQVITIIISQATIV